jgi:hypothetical protein
MKIELRNTQQTFIYIVTFLLLVTSCQKSQFAMTKRNNNNGKVSYTNTFHLETRKSSKGKFYKNQMKRAVEQSTAVIDIKTDTNPEIRRIATVTEVRYENLLASTSIEPILSVAKSVSVNIPQRSLQNNASSRDTCIENKKSKTERNEIHFSDTRKLEKKGLTGFILSILGLFPIIGLPLAIIGFIFGIKSLRKIRKNPTLYKGKGFAITSIILGIIGIIISGLLIGMFISLAIWSKNGGVL